MQQIDVSDLPEPIIRAIEVMVQSVRQQLQAPTQKKAIQSLPRWEGQVLTTLRREEIYEDVG